MKQVRETAAGRSIAAFVVLNPKGQHVATVQAAYMDSGTVMVDVWNMRDSKTQTDGPQQKKAGGGGYDKFTHALNGMMIDGHRLYDHCGTSTASTTLLLMYHKAMDRRRTSSVQEVQDKWNTRVAAKGMSFSNFKDDRYDSLFHLGGLDSLEAMGYTIIRAI